MSLKGYQWLNDNGEVVMTFIFKYLRLTIWDNDITIKEINDFIQYINERNHKIHEITFMEHIYKVKEIEPK